MCENLESRWFFFLGFFPKFFHVILLVRAVFMHFLSSDTQHGIRTLSGVKKTCVTILLPSLFLAAADGNRPIAWKLLQFLPSPTTHSSGGLHQGCVKLSGEFRLMCVCEVVRRLAAGATFF